MQRDSNWDEQLAQVIASSQSFQDQGPDLCAFNLVYCTYDHVKFAGWSETCNGFKGNQPPRSSSAPAARRLQAGPWLFIYRTSKWGGGGYPLALRHGRYDKYSGSFPDGSPPPTPPRWLLCDQIRILMCCPVSHGSPTCFLYPQHRIRAESFWKFGRFLLFLISRERHQILFVLS